MLLGGAPRCRNGGRVREMPELRGTVGAPLAAGRQRSVRAATFSPIAGRILGYFVSVQRHRTHFQSSSDDAGDGKNGGRSVPGALCLARCKRSKLAWKMVG